MDPSLGHAGPRRRHGISVVVLAALLVLAACTSARRHEILKIFFDIPEPKQADEQAKPSANQGPGLIGPVRPTEPDMVLHRPYAENKCAKCHASRFGKPAKISSIFQGVPMLLEPLEKLCFKCHEIKRQAFLHAPAISGQCIFCHDPHRTPNKRMLLFKSTRQLCARCHSGSTFLTAKAHEQYGERECIECHDPHSAPNKLNLLPGVKEGRPQPRTPTVTLPKKW